MESLDHIRELKVLPIYEDRARKPSDVQKDTREVHRNASRAWCFGQHLQPMTNTTAAYERKTFANLAADLLFYNV